MFDRISRRTFLNMGGMFLGTFIMAGAGGLSDFAYGKGELQDITEEGNIFSITHMKIPEYFEIRTGNEINLLYQGREISSNIFLSSKGKNRVLAGFLNGNSCVSLFFDETVFPENSDIAFEIKDKLKEVTAENKKTYILWKVKSNKKKLVITDIIADSIRTARDRSHKTFETYNGKEIDRVLWREKFAKNNPAMNIPGGWIKPEINLIKKDDGRTLITFYRTTLDKKFGTYGELLFPKYVDVIKEENFVKLEGNKDIAFEFLATSTFPALTPFKKEELISEKFLERINKKEPIILSREDDELSKALKEYAKYYSLSLRDLLFLSYKEVFLAGSWRYLTYFGRDTMMTVMLMGEVISREGYEAGMQSILDRLSHEGAVAHEDNSWWQAEGERISEFNRLISEGETGKAGELINKIYDENYDYKMIDDDFMFSIMLLNYLKRSDIEDKSSFMTGVNRSEVLEKETDNRLAIVKNFNMVLEKSLPYFKTFKELTAEIPDLTEEGNKKLIEKLVRINYGEKVGDWRDSEGGMGEGVYPGNVNVYLVPGALKAIYKVLQNIYGTIGSVEELKIMGEKHGLLSLLEILNSFKDNRSTFFEEFINCWSGAREHFRVKLSMTEVIKRVKNYIEGNQDFSEEDRKLILSLPVSFSETCKIGEFIENIKCPDMLKEGVEFYALSIDEEGHPVEVINSDMGFGFVMDELDIKEMEEAVKVASLNYPLGLMTEGGLLTASPALSNNKRLWQILGPGAYHGTVVWSWQMAMLTKGLLYRSGTLPSRALSVLVGEMRNLAAKMLNIENAIGEMRNFELWGVKPDYETGKMVATGYGEGSETESNAVQLWSTLALTMVNPFMFP